MTLTKFNAWKRVISLIKNQDLFRKIFKNTKILQILQNFTKFKINYKLQMQIIACQIQNTKYKFKVKNSLCNQRHSKI